jgi:lipopolysaccharide export system permease protein
MLKRIETYVLFRTLASVGGALAVITAIILLIDVVELSRDIGAQSEVSIVEVAGLTLLRSPILILQLLPFVFLFGVLAAFTGLNRRSELIAMRAAGVSAWRFILPAAVAAFLIGALTVTALNPLATVMNARAERIHAELVQGEAQREPEEVWLSQGGDRFQTLLHARNRNELGTRLSDVTVRIYARDDTGGLIFVRRIDAERAELTAGAWRLTDAAIGNPGQPAIRTPVISVPTTVDARSALERFASPRTVAFWDLPERARVADEAGLSSLRYRLQWHQLLASPLLYAAMSILAAGFSLRLLRLGGLAGLAGAAVALGFVLFFFNELLSAMGSAELLPPYAAAWASPVLAMLAGLTLLAFTEDG